MTLIIEIKYRNTLNKKFYKNRKKKWIFQYHELLMKFNYYRKIFNTI